MTSDLDDLKNDLGIIWGAANIGCALGLTKRQAFHLLETGQLNGATKIGSRWAITRQALLANFAPALRDVERLDERAPR